MKNFFCLILSIVGLLVFPASALSTRIWAVGDSESVMMRENRFSRLTTLRGGQEDVGTYQEEEATPDKASTLSSAITPKLSIFTAALGTAGKVYSQQLQQRPIITKSCTAGLIFGLSDYLAQRIERSSDEEKPFDRTRFIVSTLVGLCYFGPAAHYWYNMVFAVFPGKGLVSTLQKAGLGQLLFGPSFTCIFFAASLLQTGQFSLSRWFQKIRSDLPGAWLAGCGFWPVVDLISFSVIPIGLIPLFVNLCSLVWTIYLSLVANKGNQQS